MDRETLFRGLFSEHYTAVARYVPARGFSATDADDLIGATFEVAWRRLEAVPPGRDAVPWLLTVARNMVRNADRRARRELGTLDRLATEVGVSDEATVNGRAQSAAVLGALVS